jgi:hypothetical protein
LILLVFKKYKKKTRKIKIYKKRKVEGPILRPKQHFTYKYRSTTHTKSGGGAILKEKHIKKLNLNLNLSLTKQPPPGFGFSLLKTSC